MKRKKEIFTIKTIKKKTRRNIKESKEFKK